VAQTQYPIPVLLDARGNPFEAMQPTNGVQAAPPGAILPNGAAYGPTYIIVDPGGGSVQLTDRDADFRAMPYADIQASQSPVAAVVGGMQRRLSLVPRRVFRRPARAESQNGRAKHPDIDEDNTLHDLLHKPAPGFGPGMLRQWQTLPWWVHGNSLLVKFRGNGPGTAPTELFPLDWRWAQAWSRIGTPVLMWATVQTGQWVWIRPSEVIHTMWASVAGPQGAWLGTSPLGQLGVTIKIDEAAAAFAASRFNNASRPGGVVTLPAGVMPQQVPEYTTQARNTIEGAYRGEDKAFRAAVLAGGATWMPWNTGNDEAQLTQTRQQDFLEVCGVYDQPFGAIFGTAGATAEGEAQRWKALKPWASAADEAMQTQLVDPEPEWAGLFVHSDFSEWLEADPLVVSDKMVEEFVANLRTRDEARKVLGLAPVDGGDNVFFSDLQPAVPQMAPGGKTPLPEGQVEQADAREISAFGRI
jgi:HK97 family phage portal protein